MQVDGKVKHPITFSYHDLLSMPSKTLILPLECAGNKRALFKMIFPERFAY
ncbi:molybdopterin-dependent oxidoreductase [Cohnella kolymensis]|uniref:molybdopterin-dependent oxidoreductase n=1 Tax=Cohnella kolymensis TaxID=1590652 RepID=UPI003898EC2C